MNYYKFFDIIFNSHNKKTNTQFIYSIIFPLLSTQMTQWFYSFENIISKFNYTKSYFLRIAFQTIIIKKKEQVKNATQGRIVR